MHQGAVLGLNTLLPVLGAVAMALTLVLTLRAGAASGPRWPFLVALVCMIGAGAVTRGFNQPINTIVMGWKPDSLPDGWEVLRASWWSWHEARTGLSALGFLALATGILTARA